MRGSSPRPPPHRSSSSTAVVASAYAVVASGWSLRSVRSSSSRSSWTPRATCQFSRKASRRSHSPAATAAYPSSNHSGSGRRTRARSARWASSCLRAADSRMVGRSDNSTTVLRFGNAAPSLQLGRRPPVSESNVARVGARIRRMGRSGNGPTPGNGAAPSAAWASPRARACCDGQATAVTRPTVTPTGGPLCSSSQTRPRCAAALAPGIELVRLEAVFPRSFRLVLIAGEPIGAPQLVIRLDQVRPELERLLEEGLGVLVHLALQVDEPEIEVGVERGLLVVIEPDGLREMLDRFAEDALLQTDVPDVDAGERVRGLLHQHLLKRAERIVVVLVQHLRPPEERFGLRFSGGELQRLLQRLDRTRIVPERDQAPPLFDESRRADVVCVDRGARARELRRRRLRRGGGDLLEAVHQLADLFLERRQLADERIDLLEVGDDFALHGLALSAVRHRLEATGDLLVLGSQGRERARNHHAFAGSRTAVSSASFSFEVSSRAVLSTMIVRPSFTTRPVMYSAARPLTIAGGDVISGAATCSTSVTASTMTPSLPPSHSRITVRVSSRSGAGALSRLRRSTSGTATPW